MGLKSWFKHQGSGDSDISKALDMVNRELDKARVEAENFSREPEVSEDEMLKKRAKVVIDKLERTIKKALPSFIFDPQFSVHCTKTNVKGGYIISYDLEFFYRFQDKLRDLFPSFQVRNDGFENQRYAIYGGSRTVDIAVTHNEFKTAFKSELRDIYSSKEFKKIINTDSLDRLHHFVIDKYADSFHNMSLLVDKTIDINDNITPDVSDRVLKAVKLFMDEIKQVDDGLAMLAEVEKKILNDSIISDFDKELEHIQSMVYQKHDWKVEVD